MIASPSRPLHTDALFPELAGSYQFSLNQYRALVSHDLLTTADKVELLDGYVLYKLDHTTPPPASRFYPQWQQLRRWTLAEYRRMVELGILTPDDKLEFIDGYLVLKMPQNTPHRSSVLRMTTRLPRLLPDGWVLMSQCPLEVGNYDPEPDGAVLRGVDSDYDRRVPIASDCGLVIEVSDTSLREDRRVKAVIYAEAAIPTYWIANVEERRVETYSNPSGSVYATRTDYLPGQFIPLMLDGQLAANIPVDALLP